MTNTDTSANAPVSDAPPAATADAPATAPAATTVPADAEALRAQRDAAHAAYLAKTAAEHNGRILAALNGGGYSLPGVRLQAGDGGLVVALAPEEQTSVIAAIKAVVEKRPH
jgi:hypothetical protein